VQRIGQESGIHDTKEEPIMTRTLEHQRTTVATNAVTIDQSRAVQVAVAYLLRYGLVLVIAWIGLMKFTRQP
jgi:hypothetical protein